MGARRLAASHSPAAGLLAPTDIHVNRMRTAAK
jgi:hypothetical protein